jgi:hypothetical protein
MNDSKLKTAEPPSENNSPGWLESLFGTPLMLLGGFVTTVFIFMLCTYVAGRVAGGRPQPDLIDFLILWLIFGAAPLGAGALLLRTAKSRGRFTWLVLSLVFFLFLVVGADGRFGPTNWHQLFRREKRPGTDAASLTRTIISAHLDAPITKGTSVLWCGTFQLAWNEACQLTGGDLQFNPNNVIVASLNKHAFTKESLDPGSYVAIAGFAGDEIDVKIQRAIEDKFQGSFKPRFIPAKALTPRSQDFVAYACLYKKLSFSVPFERLDEVLIFGGIGVPAFGLGYYKASMENLYPQVLILDYQNENDFVIELKTKTQGDRIILAKLEPRSNLAETIASVGERISRGQPESAMTNDLLLVPRMDFDLTREYSEIEYLHLIPKATNVATDLILRSAVQNTKFEMNEKGVELKSEAHMAFACAQREQPIPKHKMIFDQPFFVLLQRADAKMPYFALWVDNPEILVSWK